MIQNVGPQFTQWDTGRSVSISDSNATHVHFANQGDSKAVIIEITEGSAKVPDYLFQTGKTLLAYAVLDGVTLECKSFAVRKRERPENYVYEEDQRNYIYELITSAETAIKEANTAAESANQAAVKADEATASATVAVASANEASERANMAAQNANEAATKAAHTAKSLMVVGEAKGEIIALDDAIDQFLVGCRIFGKTTQDGTPTPDAPVELVSVGDGGSVCVTVCGNNLANYEAITGPISGIDTYGFVTTTNGSDKTTYIHVPIIAPYGEVTISVENISGDDVYIQKALSDYSVNSNVSFTRTVNADGYLRVMWAVRPGVTSKVRVMAVRGSTAMPYEPFKNQTVSISTPNGLPGIPVTSGGNYTDANGQQWICDEIDFARGVYVQKILRISLPVANMDNSENYPGWKNAGLAKYFPDGNGTINNWGSVSMCNISNSTPHINSKEGNDILLITDYGGTTQTGWKTNYPDLVFKMICSIPTPIETPLSEGELAAYTSLHTYRGNTTVSNDAGAYMELEYVMDAKKYIDSLVTSSLLTATVE